jgi:hypothetical protein
LKAATMCLMLVFVLLASFIGFLLFWGGLLATSFAQ